MGPLRGTKVVELASIGPGPFCAMLLADLGAEVLAVDRPVAGRPGWPALFGRGRRRVAVDLRHPDGPGLVLDLAAGADALVEGFRPGVAERLGVGSEACLARNPRLVYGRVTGWGQDGPLAGSAGHDIDYIALAGALHPIGPAGGPPVPPLNLLGDFGGGGMLLALGVVAALLEAARSGRGQVVDAAMVDGAALLTTQLHELLAAGLWADRREANLLDGAAPFYAVYETADGRHLAVGALEPRFWAELLERAGLAAEDLPAQLDRDGWPRAWPPSSAPGPGRSGAPSWRAPTPASPPSSPCWRRPAIPTTGPGAASSRSAGPSSPPPPPASAAPPAPSRPPPAPARTRPRPWPPGASRPTGSPSYGRPAPSAGEHEQPVVVGGVPARRRERRRQRHGPARAGGRVDPRGPGPGGHGRGVDRDGAAGRQVGDGQAAVGRPGRGRVAVHEGEQPVE